MKQLFILLFAFCSITAMAQYPISSINITMPSQPDLNTANWATGAVPFMITAQAQLLQGQLPARVVESSMLVTIKAGGNKICGTYTSQNAPRSNFNKGTMVWSGGAALGLLGQDCILKAGTYELCVQFFSSYAPIQPLSNEVCKTFTIADAAQASVTPPSNLLPADGAELTAQAAALPITFRWRWTAIRPPPPNKDISFKLTIKEIEPGQTKTQAYQNNSPLAVIDVKNLTQTTYRLAKRYNGIVWSVEAFGNDRAQGGELKSYGSSDPTMFKIIVTDPGGCMAIDTSKYTVVCKGIDPNGKYIYQITDLILKNISTNPGRTGLFANSATNYIQPDPIGSFTIQSLTPASANPINAANQISISFEAHSTSTTSLSFYVDATIPLGTTYCDKHILVQIDALPSCICNPCKDKRTSFGNPVSLPVVSYQNDGSVSVSSSVTHVPKKVIKVSAEIVDIERMGENGCLRCTKESKEFGNFTGGTLNSLGGNIVNGVNGYGKQIEWKQSAPSLINNFSYNLQMMFPPLTDVSCCKDSIRYCIRWSFTDENCITCDTLVCSIITREYKKPVWPIWTTGARPYASQISKMGEPFVSWYNQTSNELPKEFESQIEALLKRQPIDEREIKKEEFVANMKNSFYSVRSLATRGTDAVWDVISANPLVIQCDNGNFESGTVNASSTEWNEAYGSLMPNNSDPSLATYTAGFSPTSVGTNLLISSGTNRHSIVTYAIDPIVGANLNTTAMATNAYSLRIGNAVNGGGTEMVSKTFVVSGNGIIKFMYALVLQDPGHPLNSSGGYQNPSFWVKVYDNSGNPMTGKVYLEQNSTTPLDVIVANSANHFFQTMTYAGQPLVYRDWTCAKIDLSQYIGQTMSVALINTDCAQGGHFGYTYIDNWCGNCDGSSSGSVNINAIADPCIKPGARVCVDYTLPKIGTTIGTGNIKLQFYYNGTVVSTLTSTPLTSPTGTYCFTIDPAQLPCSNGQAGYDMLATGNFSITPIGGSPTPIVVTSPDPVGNYEGIKPGFNNDMICCIPPVDNCCNGFVKSVTAQVSMVGSATAGYNTIKFVPTFTAGPKLIKQVRISVVNFESSSANRECLSCEANTGRYGTMSVPQSIFGTGAGKDAIEGMVYPTTPLTMACFPIPCPSWNSLPTSEVTWGSNSGPGYNLMDGVGDQTTTFFVSLPKRSTLSCCDDTVKVCIKYSFTDVDCKTCDTIICYKVVNRKTITLLSFVSPVIPGNNQKRGIPAFGRGDFEKNGLLAVLDGEKKNIK